MMPHQPDCSRGSHCVCDPPDALGPDDPCATATPAQAPSNQPAPSMTGGVAYGQGNDR